MFERIETGLRGDIVLVNRHDDIDSIGRLAARSGGLCGDRFIERRPRDGGRRRRHDEFAVEAEAHAHRPRAFHFDRDFSRGPAVRGKGMRGIRVQHERRVGRAPADPQLKDARFGPCYPSSIHALVDLQSRCDGNMRGFERPQGESEDLAIFGYPGDEICGCDFAVCSRSPAQRVGDDQFVGWINLDGLHEVLPRAFVVAEAARGRGPEQEVARARRRATTSPVG